MLRRRLPVLALALAAALGAAACKKKESAAAGGPAGGAAAAPATIKVTLSLDDKMVAHEATLSATPRPLAELIAGAPPLEGWIAVEVIDAAGVVTTILAPAKNHAGLVPALTAGAGGATFGMARAGKLEQAVARVARVTIKTRSDAGRPVEGADHAGGHGGGDSGGGGDHGSGGNGADKGVRPTPTADLTIEIERGSGAATLTGDKLVGLPEIKAPEGDTETPGWNLVDVLGAAGITGAKVVTLTDAENAALRLEGADWDPAKTVLYLKLNRSGQIRFRVFRKTGDRWEIGGELRGIKKIKVVE